MKIIPSMVRSFIKITYCLIFIYSSLLSAQAYDTIDNISLNGKWAILFDQDNRGGIEKWHLKHVRPHEEDIIQTRHFHTSMIWQTSTSSSPFLL